MRTVPFISLLLFSIFPLISASQSLSATHDCNPEAFRDMANLNVCLGYKTQSFFKERLAQKSEDGQYLVLAIIKEGNCHDLCWIENIELNDSKYYGTVFSEMNFINSINIGDSVSVNESDVIDWFFVEGQKKNKVSYGKFSSGNHLLGDNSIYPEFKELYYRYRSYCNKISLMKFMSEAGDDMLVQIPDSLLTHINPDIKPEFPGGSEKMWNFIGRQLPYPVLPDGQRLEGPVLVGFVIDKDGSVIYPQVIKSLHPVYDQVALDVLKQMPKWIPGQANGEIVRTTKTFTITFTDKTKHY